MSGHNKWSKVKHKKAAEDAKKSKIFSKLVRLIKVEAKRAAGDMNDPGLKAAIEKAKTVSMPKENIERAIKGAGHSSESLESITYESYGPGGAAMMIDVLTDNKKRASAEIKHLLSKYGLSLASPGSASWTFSKSGVEWVPNSKTQIGKEDSKKLMEVLEELEENEDVQGIYTNV